MIICQHLKLFDVVEKIVFITQIALVQNITSLLLQSDVLVSQTESMKKYAEWKMLMRFIEMKREELMIHIF